MSTSSNLVFYYADRSTASLTEAILAELDIPHERITLDLSKGESRTTDFLAINPNGVVPTIIHNGVPIWESAAITLYLGETFGVERNLFPPPGINRGEAMKWTIWANVSLYADLAKMWDVPGESEDEAQKRKEKATIEVQKRLDVLEIALKERNYLCGETYTIVDTHMVNFVGYAKMLKIDLSSCEHVEAWLLRCQERPVLKKLNEKRTSS